MLSAIYGGDLSIRGAVQNQKKKKKKQKQKRELPEALVSFLYNLSGFLSICLSLPIISLCDVFRFGLRCVLDLGF